jgi:hypothetical protein
MRGKFCLKKKTPGMIVGWAQVLCKVSRRAIKLPLIAHPTTLDFVTIPSEAEQPLINPSTIDSDIISSS